MSEEVRARREPNGRDYRDRLRETEDKLNRDVPEPPNKDEIRPDDDVTPDAGTIEPPD